jgi:hypothetical protein
MLFPRQIVVAALSVALMGAPALAELSTDQARKAARDARSAVKDISAKAPQFAPVRDIFFKQCRTEFKSEDRQSKGKFCECGADIAMVLAIEGLEGDGSKKGSMNAMVGNFMKAGSSENYAPVCKTAYL